MKYLDKIKKDREKKSAFISAIVSCLYDVKAYNLPTTCSNYGLEKGEESEAYSSKTNYVKSRVQNKGIAELIDLSLKILEDHYSLELENLVLLENESELNNRVTEPTILDLLEYLDQIILHGRIASNEFITSLRDKGIFYSAAKRDLELGEAKHKGKDMWSYYQSYGYDSEYFKNSELVKNILELHKLPQTKIFSFIELLVSPEVRKENEVEMVVRNINKILQKDGFLLKKIDPISPRSTYKVMPLNTPKILNPSFSSHLNTKEEISEKFIEEHAEECRKYIEQNKYYDAISDARSMVENVFEVILRKSGVECSHCSGDLGKLFKEVKKILNFEAQNLKTKVKDDALQEAFIKISGSLEEIVKSIGTISNKMSKRHSRSSESLRHHALLAVNCAYTVCNFIFDSYEYQKKVNAA